MFSTSSFNASLINSIINFMKENNVSRFDIGFLASGKHGFPSSSEVAKKFIDEAHWEYFFIKNDKLCLHKNYHGDLGLTEYDYEITSGVVTYDSKSEVFGNSRIMTIHTADLVKLVQIAYDTIGNINF